MWKRLCITLCFVFCATLCAVPAVFADDTSADSSASSADSSSDSTFLGDAGELNGKVLYCIILGSVPVQTHRGLCAAAPTAGKVPAQSRP